VNGGSAGDVTANERRQEGYGSERLTERFSPLTSIRTQPYVNAAKVSLRRSPFAQAMTLEPEPSALLSTRNRLRSALHRWCGARVL
jgi:hypothetical protein